MNKGLLTVMVLVLMCFISGTYAQTTANLADDEVQYQKCLELYNEGVYGAASQLLLKYIDEQEFSRNVNREENIKKASLLFAKSAVKLEKQEGEKLILNFVRTYAPDPIASGALREMADYYFNNREYAEAERYYNQINTSSLSKKEKEEVIFRKAYLLFVKKKFAAAKSKFQMVKYPQSEYYLPATYYFGLCSFYQNKYEDAISSFQKLNSSRRYSKYTPYYIAQIYFKQERYDDLIAYATKQLDDNYNLRNRNEINQLIAQSYFEQGDYKSALPYYEFFMERMNKLRVEDFYQAGYVYYKNQRYGKAKRYFEELGGEPSLMAQNGLYHLADCYVKEGDKNSARNAFYKCSQWNFDRQIQSDAHFHYAKLSYELGYDNDAIKAFQSIPTSSENYRKSQELLGQLFLSTNNYKRAEKLLSQMDRRSPMLEEAYHKVLFYRAIEEYNSRNLKEAESYFLRASKKSNHQPSRAMSLFWLADIQHQNDNYTKSIGYLNDYFRASQGLSREIEESSGSAMANYLLAYNYIKNKSFGKAKEYFNKAIVELKGNRFENAYIKDQILPDAYLRLGDCYFKENNYPLALSNYDKVSLKNNQNYIYALYQKAIIKGLKGNQVEKVIDLERIAEKYPDSKYADDALYELGISYLEIGQLNKGRIPLEKLVNRYRQKSELVNQSYLKLGLIAYNQGSTSQAIKYYRSCLDNNPNPTESQNALLALREIYIDDLGQPDKYFEIQEEYTGYAFSEAGKDSLSYRVAERKFEEGNYNGAITEFGNYIRKYPKGVFVLHAYFYRGESHFIQKNYSNALDNYELIAKRGQSQFYEDALLKAALISYNHEEDFRKALEYYTQLDQVARSQENRFQAQIGAMRSAYKLNETVALEKMAQKVIGNNLANQEQSGTAYYYLGKVNYDKQNLSVAEVNFIESSKRLSNVFAAESRYYLAEISYLQANLDVAKTRCVNANRSNTNYTYWLAKGIILLSDILKDQKDYFNAKAALESLLENYDEDQELIAIAKAKLQTLEELDRSNLLAPSGETLELEDN